MRCDVHQRLAAQRKRIGYRLCASRPALTSRRWFERAG